MATTRKRNNRGINTPGLGLTRVYGIVVNRVGARRQAFQGSSVPESVNINEKAPGAYNVGEIFLFLPKLPRGVNGNRRRRHRRAQQEDQHHEQKGSWLHLSPLSGLKLPQVNASLVPRA